MINGRFSVKEDVPEIKSSVTLLIDHVVKMFLKNFPKYLLVVISIICTHPVAVERMSETTLYHGDIIL